VSALNVMFADEAEKIVERVFPENFFPPVIPKLHDGYRNYRKGGLNPASSPAVSRRGRVVLTLVVPV
jgi:hypothetical protein